MFGIQSLNAYVPPISTAAFGALSSSALNTKFTQSDGINDILTLLASKNTITADANVTLTQNEDCTVLMPNTANRTITLPPLSGQIFPIYVKKMSNGYDYIDITRNGAPDTMDNPFALTAVPVATSARVYLPGEDFLLFPSGTYWRVSPVSPLPSSLYRAFGNRTSNQALGTGTFDVVLLSEVVDLGSFYNPANGRFTPQIPGWYDIDITGTVTSGSSGTVNIVTYKNGSLDTPIGQLVTTGDTVFSSSYSIQMNGSTDYVEMRGFSSVAGKSVFGIIAGNYTKMEVRLSRRT